MISTSIRRLEVFLAVAETGRFSLAAERLGIAQPSVSAHIAGLERQIGQPLFLRTPGRASALSQAGRSLLTYASEVLAKSREASDALSRIHVGANEQLTITAQRCIANHLLPPVVTEFLKSNSKCRIRLISEIQENVMSMVSDGSADLGLFLGVRKVRGLPSEIVGHLPLAIVVGAGHELARRERVTPQELADHAFIGGLQGSQFARMVGAALHKMGVRNPQFILWMQDANALTAVARSGLGVLCTPLCNVEDDLKSGALRMVRATVRPQPLQIRMALQVSSHASGAAQRFAEYVRDVRLSS
jgi:DNA-binding transcriptional LysR family regulator